MLIIKEYHITKRAYFSALSNSLCRLFYLLLLIRQHTNNINPMRITHAAILATIIPKIDDFGLNPAPVM